MFTSHLALHKDYPLVCRWFISLARQDHFTFAVWKASNDVGFDAFHDFVKGARKAHSSHSVLGESEGGQQVKGKGQNVKPSKPATGSKSSSQQVPKKAATTDSIVSLFPLSLPLPLFPPSLSVSPPLYCPSLVPVFLCYTLQQHTEHNPDHVIPAADLEAAKEAWLKGIDGVPKPRKREHPM